jgi:uncharacterized protein YbdZ (MbtH family)
VSAAIIPLHVTALAALQPAIQQVEANPDCCLIIDSTTGRSQAWPRHSAVPPGWYRFSINVKQRKVS